MFADWFDRRPLWQIALLAAIVPMIVYGPFLKHGFVSFDDSLLITKNPAVVEFSWWSFKRIFTTYDPELYIPFTLFTYQITYALAGPNAFWFHLTDLLLHAGNAAFVFLILSDLLGNRRWAFLGALLFAVHPLNTEAVLWAAARKDTLSSLFFLGSIFLYLRFLDTEKPSILRWCMATFAAGLLSKVSVISLPIVLLLIDTLKNRKRWKELLQEKIPFFVLAMIFGTIAIIGKAELIPALSPWQNCLLLLRSAVFYLQKFFLPTHLAVTYQLSTPVTFYDPAFAIPPFIILGFGASAFLLRRKIPLYGKGLLLAFLVLLPNATNFWKNGFTFFASDRYAYLPLIGIILALLALLDWLWLAIRSWRMPAALAAIASGGALLLFASLAREQATTWESNESLYRNVIRSYPNGGLAHNNLGDALMKSGHETEAEEEFRTALSLDPTLFATHLYLGDMQRRRGNWQKAIDEFEQALAIVEKKQHLYIEDLAPYYYMGEILGQRGKNEEALVLFKRAAERSPLVPDAHFNLGLHLQSMGKTDEAIAAFERTVALQDRYLDAHYHLASLYAETGRLRDALRELDVILKYQPGNEEARRHRENIEKILKTLPSQ